MSDVDAGLAARQVMRRAAQEFGSDVEGAALVYGLAFCAICAEAGDDPRRLVGVIMAEVEAIRATRPQQPV